jgi:pimeloyl-ACP methyl ester carboxylesterase
MKTSLHTISTEDGLQLHGVLYQPEEKTDIVLVHVHGMGGNFYENKFTENLAKTLTDNGIAFFPFNNRGNGSITDFVRIKNDKKDFVTYGTTNEKFEDSPLDIQAGIDFVKEKGFTKIHLSGHSLGAPKVAYYASKTKENLQSIIFLSPADMLGLAREDKDQFEKEITNAKKMIEDGKGDELLPEYVWGDYLLKANTYINLFGDESETAIFNFHNKDLGFETISKIDEPILTIMGRKDDVAIIPIEEIMEIMEKEAISSPRSETKILGDSNHIYQGYEQELADVLKDWIVSV